VDVPRKAKKVIVTLEGYDGADDFDLSLAAIEGDFAYHDVAANVNAAPGCNKTLVLKKPAAGKLYISVFCETAPTAGFGENGVVYSGRTDVLNGVPYKIKVNIR
jgi:hypothetical protein